MRKNKSRSSVRPVRIRKKSAPFKRRMIDYSDIPEMSDAQLRVMRRK
jgi:hypothetical protein